MAIKIITISDGFESALIPSIVSPAAQGLYVVFLQLTSPQLAFGTITLPTIPYDPTETIVVWLGIGQTYGEDYTVSGSSITLLPNLLDHMTIGDNLTITYS